MVENRSHVREPKPTALNARFWQRWTIVIVLTHDNKLIEIEEFNLTTKQITNAIIMDIYSKLSSASSKSFPQDHAPDTTEGADATTSPLQLRLDDREKLCEEGSLTHTSIEEYDYDYDYDKQDNDINNGMSMSIELKSPRRRSSISDYTKRCLPADTFSFLIYSSVQSRPFFLAAFVFLLQIAILVILSLDIINLDNDNAKNPMNFPPNVEYPVRVSEVLAIMIAIITQEDIRKAVSLLRDGFDENLQKKFKGATFERWVLSIASRASEGLLGLFVTFLLIMRSSSVLDLLLNFLAVEFVTMLDDVVSCSLGTILHKIVMEYCCLTLSSHAHTS